MDLKPLSALLRGWQCQYTVWSAGPPAYRGLPCASTLSHAVGDLPLGVSLAPPQDQAGTPADAAPKPSGQVAFSVNSTSGLGNVRSFQV